MTRNRPHRKSAALAFFLSCIACGAPLALWQHASARADDTSVASPVNPRLRLRLEGGAGTHESSLPGVNGTRTVTAAWVPVAGFHIALSQSRRERLRFGAELIYLSSTKFELSRAIEPDTVERSDARMQELSALGRLALALDKRATPITLPISIGYGLSAFTTDTPLTAAQAYMVSGPRVGLGIELPLWAERVNLSGRAELGANLTETQALRDAGVGTLGWTYAFQAEANVRLTGMLQVGVRFREAYVDLPHSGSGSFHEQRRFVLASVTLRNPR